MKALAVTDGWGIDHLQMIERPVPEPGRGQVRVRMQAASLNYRDYLTVLGKTGHWPQPFVPFSDGAGVIDAVGPEVEGLEIGQPVCPLFYQRWLEGPPSDRYRPWVLGGTQEGILQQQAVFDGGSVIAPPAGWSAVEAATLPCAGLTAWRALAEESQIGPGSSVLVQGTGGVSIFALQFAKAMGARVIVTSSSDAKLERARALGADDTINYRSTPDWSKAVNDLTDGEGVDLVVEVGGAETFNPSIGCTRSGGRIILIGVLSGFRQEILVPSIFAKQLHIIGISVGSRAHFANMVHFIERHALIPEVDQVWAWEHTADALRAMEQAGHFGKLCVEIS